MRLLVSQLWFWDNNTKNDFREEKDCKYIAEKEDSMKVLIFRTNGNVVNLKTYNLQEIGIAKALQMRGIDCDVMYYGGKKPTHDEMVDFQGRSIKVIWANGFSIAGNGFFPKVGEILNKYDIIQVCEYDQLFSRYIAFFSKYKDRVCMTHGPYYNITNKKYNLKINLLDKLWIPKKQKESTWCFAKSIYAKDFLKKRGFKRVIVTGVGLDIDRFEYSDQIPPNEIVNELTRFKDGNHLLLYIGQISERRNTIFLIEMMKKMKEISPDIKLAIIGDGLSNYKNKCLKLIDDYNLRDRIYYTPQIVQEQVPYLYNIADVFLLPTYYEIFGMVMLEAMYFRTPFITTDNGGSITVIKNMENGCILPLDVNEWVKTIISLITNSEQARLLAENEHITIVEKYTWNQVVEGMVNAYKSILDQR